MAHAVTNIDRITDVIVAVGMLEQQTPKIVAP